MSIPDFPISCKIWSGSAPPPAAPRLTSACNLQYARKSDIKQGHLSLAGAQLIYLLLPPLTDIRGAIQGQPNDIVEAPAGSGRYYSVFSIEDVSKGFPGEYRVALVVQDVSVAFWPVPMP